MTLFGGTLLVALGVSSSYLSWKLWSVWSLSLTNGYMSNCYKSSWSPWVISLSVIIGSSIWALSIWRFFKLIDSIESPSTESTSSSSLPLLEFCYLLRLGEAIMSLFSKKRSVVKFSTAKMFTCVSCNRSFSLLLLCYRMEILLFFLTCCLSLDLEWLLCWEERLAVDLVVLYC